MDALLKKLNFKPEMKIRLWNVPDELETLVQSWQEAGFLVTSEQRAVFFIAFVYSKEDVDRIFPEIHQLCPEDEVIWMAYPKGSSKKYKATINRDHGWGTLGNLDYEPVRQIAINEDWSALRFRKTSFIKTMTRKFSSKNQ